MGIIGKLTFYCQGCLVSVLGAIWRLMEPVCVYLVRRSDSYRNNDKRIAQSLVAHAMSKVQVYRCHYLLFI